MKPKISIIVPVYNVEQYLSQCLDSLINQTLKDIEIICVNDSSHDGSLKVLEEYANKDNRIKIINHSENKGLGAARNTGIDAARAKFVGFIDSDDFVDEEMFYLLYNEIANVNVDIAWCDFRRFIVEDDIVGTTDLPRGLYTIQEVLANAKFYPSILSVCNKLYKKELLEGIRFPNGYSEDQKFNAEYFLKTKKISVIDKTYYFYRIREGSISKSKELSKKDWNDYLNAYETSISILSRRFSISILKPQIILRVSGMFLRMTNYQTLTSSNKRSQFIWIRNYVQRNGMHLKEASRFYYRIVMMLTNKAFPQKIKKILLRYALRSSLGGKHPTFITTAHFLSSYLKKLFLYIERIIEFYIVDLCAFVIRLYYYKGIWLFSERIDSAQDNGYYLFRYVKKKHKKENAFYIIDVSSKECENLQDFSKNIIPYNSWKHKVYFRACKYYCHAYFNICYPTTYFLKRKYNLKKKTLDIFLPHGITYADSSQFYSKAKTNIDLIISTGSVGEYKFFIEKFGYRKHEVSPSGFPRFDGLHEYNVNKTILFAPTWRRNLYMQSETMLKQSKYYSNVVALLNNPVFNMILEKNGLKCVFFPHRLMLDYAKLFLSDSKNIVLPKKNTKVQDLLKQASLLITDMSSIHFDFAYMHKPVIYYFWDYKDFCVSHMKEGFYNHKKMGFGEVFSDVNNVVSKLEQYIKDGFKVEQKYVQRVDGFFTYHDELNSYRAYHAIKSFVSVN